jgi:hypothetical protein
VTPVLLACPACKRMISSSAYACPHCAEPLSDEWEAKGRAYRLKKQTIALILVLVGAPVGLFIGSKITSKDVPALAKMEAVFVGKHSQEEIKRSMDQVLTSFGQSVSEDSYTRLGSVLVRMRKDTGGVTEMSILRCMLGVKGSINQDIATGAALCATSLER